MTILFPSPLTRRPHGFSLTDSTAQIGDGGFRRYSYFVPDGIRREPNIKLLAVLGEDIGDYTLEGFQNGGCNPGEEISGVSCTVIRSETTLDAVLGPALPGLCGAV